MPHEKKEVIRMLQELQQKDGYLSREKLVEVGNETGMPLSEIYGIVTFYSFFKLNKAAKNIIQVCDGTACHVRGSEKLIDEVKAQLGIGEGEMTEDGTFSMEVVRCLGMCASAPLIKINDDVHPKVSKDQVKDLIGKY
ncbi:MAG: NAD(P)H-dependent oxidoreductase subunit E [Nanoarchaeota archaeon]